MDCKYLLVILQTLLVLFYIQMITLYRDPRGERVFDKSKPTSSTTAHSNPIATTPGVQETAELVPALQNRIQEQEERIRELEEELRNSKARCNGVYNVHVAWPTLSRQ